MRPNDREGGGPPSSGAASGGEAEAGVVDAPCYCGPDDDFCGECSVCGAPGHTRAYPGLVPVTDAWCDAHYLELASAPSPTRWFHRWRWGVVILALLAAVAGWLV